MVLTENLVYIVEKASTALAVQKTGKDYILEGPCATFGQVNVNDRIYEESEYLPQLESLNKKISENRLLGELDHPENFDISLKNVSHVIESLSYDKSNRTINIRVKLLDTPAGKIAKELVDNNIPISISSRAAGVVGENKKVSIKKIFTYDLVSDPGFENAQLTRVNESTMHALDLKENNSITKKLENITSLFNFDNNVNIYNVNENQDFKKILEKEFRNSTMENTNVPAKKFVTEEALQQYSLVIKEELENIKKSIPTNESEASSTISESRMAKVEKYVNYLAENLDKIISYSNYLAESQDKNIAYSKYLAETLNNDITYTKYLAENLDNNISYANYLAENVDTGITYAMYLAEKLDNNIKYSEYLAEQVDKNIDFSNYIAENAVINETVEDVKSIEETVVTAPVVTETIETVIAKIETPEIVTSEVIIPVVETQPEEILEGKYNNISTKINTILENAKKLKASTLNESKKAQFVTVLNPVNKEKFDALNETEKTKVYAALQECAKITTEAEALKVINENTVVEKPKFIANMPEKYVALFESLNSTHQEAIVAQSKMYKLETQYQINNFWSTRNLSADKIIGTEKIVNESKIETSTNRGYKDEFMSEIKAQLGKRFKK
jgi:hypothetical protein